MRETQREKLLEKQDANQQALFDGDGFPSCPAVLAAVERRTYEHKGVRLVENDERAFRLVELLVSGWGVKRIARDMQISPKTVRAARRVLVAQGKLAPYVKRVTEAMEDAIEAGVSCYRDALEDGKIPGAQIPVGVAIMFDKRALALGEPTSIRGERMVVQDLSPDALNRAMTVVEISADVVVEDCQSSQQAAKPQQIGVKPEPDATLDAKPAQPEPEPEPQPEPTSQSAVAADWDRPPTDATWPPPSAPAGGGGGVSGGIPTRGLDPKASEI